MKLRYLLPLSLAAAASAQNEILYYKFEGGAGSKALNYAPTSSPAAREGTITNTLTTAPTGSFVPGRFGTALSSGLTSPIQANYVDTGWSLSTPHTGSYTWAMWLRNSRNNPAPSLTYLAGTPDNSTFRIYTGSSILLTVGGAGGSTYYRTVANIYQMSTAAWVHVAFVVDTTTMSTTYYINGVAETPVALTALPSISGSTFLIGRNNYTSAPSIYDIDEFRFVTRAVTMPEIMAWSLVSASADAPFGVGCDATLLSSGGVPQPGNVFYGFSATGQNAAAGSLLLGLSRTSLGGIPLPVNLGVLFSTMNGCPWESSGELSLNFVLGTGGTGSLPFPIPPNPTLDGLNLYAQAIFLGGPRTLMATNPVALSIGN